MSHVHDRVACGTLDDGSGSGDASTDGGGSTGPASTGSGEGSTGHASTGAGEQSTSAQSTSAQSTSAQSTSAGEDSTSSGEHSTGAEPSDGIPTPTAPCPTFTDGVVTFCPAGLDTCRDARVVNADGANGGPLALHWHGTFESPDGVLSWDWAAQQIAAMVEAQDGLMVLPYADPGAPTRPGTPFPWWVVCGAVGTQCDRLDDFVLADEIVACAVDQGSVDPERLTTSGMSAGGIMTSHLVDRTSYLAGAVSWSGGLQVAYQPANPDNDTALMVMHGGDTDLYCGPGAAGAGGCYDFRVPSEIFAVDVAAAGNFAFLCDHQAGHSASMGGQGAQFLALAHRSGHPWAGYSFGSGGNWMLDHYCYEPGDPSPWD